MGRLYSEGQRSAAPAAGNRTACGRSSSEVAVHPLPRPGALQPGSTGADEDLREPTDEEVEAMLAEIVAEDGGGGESEAEALYRQLEAI